MIGGNEEEQRHKGRKHGRAFSNLLGNRAWKLLSTTSPARAQCPSVAGTGQPLPVPTNLGRERFLWSLSLSCPKKRKQPGTLPHQSLPLSVVSCIVPKSGEVSIDKPLDFMVHHCTIHLIHGCTLSDGPVRNGVKMRDCHPDTQVLCPLVCFMQCSLGV